MKHITEMKDFKALKTNATNEEMVIKADDVYKVKTSVEIPVSLVTQYIRKVKDESGKSIRELYSDMEIAEELVNYMSKTYANLENFPASIVLGTDYTKGGVSPIMSQGGQPQGQPQGQSQGQSQGQPQGQSQGQPQGQSQGQPQGQSQGQPQGQRPAQTAQQIPPSQI